MSCSSLHCFLVARSLTLAALAPLVAHAGGHSESVSGDLSNSGFTPTAVTLTLGANAITGAIGNAGGVDHDYFTFTLPADWQLDAIRVGAGTAIGENSPFIGMEAGGQVRLSPKSGIAIGLLGWALYGAEPGVDLLPEMAVPSLGSSGFSVPLGAGTYAVWIRDTAEGSFAYNFNFQVSAVPEPAGFALMGAGLLGLAALRQRRARCTGTQPAPGAYPGLAAVYRS